jgi:hypothetical protein
MARAAESTHEAKGTAALACGGRGRRRGRGWGGARPGGRVGRGQEARGGAAREGAREARGARAARGGRGGRGEEEEEEGEREKGSSPRESKSGDHCLQNLGHHGEDRDGRERELCVGELNEGKETRGGGAHGEGQGARGTRAKAGPCRIGLGWAAPRVKIRRHAQPQLGNQFVKRD